MKLFQELKFQNVVEQIATKIIITTTGKYMLYVFSYFMKRVTYQNYNLDYFN